MPVFDSDRGHRRSIRLRGYDYSQPGAYFVTICTHEREPLLGTVGHGEVTLSDYGEMVWAAWQELPGHYRNVALDAFVVMPNHVHGIILLQDGKAQDGVGAGFEPAPLSEIVRALKTFSARRINDLRGSPGNPVWQRNYYEHIVRNDSELARIRQYIEANPKTWESDEYYAR